ncbi:MAG: carbohydrate kinase [Acidobacteria bacterium]|nr:carbohydrate kinase [Acidobacteriota bacterium]
MPESGPLLLGIDLGSSGVKATLVSPERGIVASTSCDVALYSDHPGWAEADPAEWWTATCEVIARLLAESGCAPRDVVALAVSGMVPAVVVCDERGVPLRRAILQNDARATGEIRELQRALEHLDLLRLTGSVLSQQSVSPTVLWLARSEPAVWSRTVSVQGSYDWLARQFGAEAHVEQNWALESGLYDLELRPLNPVPAATQIDWPAFLPVRRPGSIVGEVSAAAAAASGLSAGTTIVVGGADHVLSAYGAGLVKSGDALIKLGGAGDILAVSKKVFVDRRLYLDAHPIPGSWLPNGCMATSGSVLRWEQALFGGVALDTLDDEARVSRPGALVSLPYFLGEKTPLHDPDLRGVIAGLHLGTTRGDLHRSFLEGIAYGFKAHVDVFAEGGLELGNVRVTNGGSRSRLWREILADVLHRDLVSIVNHPGASYGAAVIAGIGTGMIHDWTYVTGALEKGEVISPRPENIAVYEERFQQFLQLGAASAPVSHSLARSPL